MIKACLVFVALGVHINLTHSSDVTARSAAPSTATHIHVASAANASAHAAAGGFSSLVQRPSLAQTNVSLRGRLSNVRSSTSCEACPSTGSVEQYTGGGEQQTPCQTYKGLDFACKRFGPVHVGVFYNSEDYGWQWCGGLCNIDSECKTYTVHGYDHGPMEHAKSYFFECYIHHDWLEHDCSNYYEKSVDQLVWSAVCRFTPA